VIITILTFSFSYFQNKSETERRNNELKGKLVSELRNRNTSAKAVLQSLYRAIDNQSISSYSKREVASKLKNCLDSIHFDVDFKGYNYPAILVKLRPLVPSIEVMPQGEENYVPYFRRIENAILFYEGLESLSIIRSHILEYLLSA
jgi:hypothetical protein